jgi:hypoxanthine-DNA glycosylase
VNKPSEGFAPVSDPSARVLILGSLPGAVSLERQQYYAKPQNVFWKIMGTLVGARPELPYAQRTDALTKAGIALWDVCASAHRIGSLDSAIKHHAANDFASFFAKHPKIYLERERSVRGKTSAMVLDTGELLEESCSCAA